MFYLKSNNIEDWFRRAAEEYDLDAHKASDWDRVQASLRAKEPDEPDDEKKKKRRFFFWWWLLIPVGILGYYIGQQTSLSKTAHVQTSIAKKTNPADQPASLSDKKTMGNMEKPQENTIRILPNIPETRSANPETTETGLAKPLSESQQIKSALFKPIHLRRSESETLISKKEFGAKKKQKAVSSKNTKPSYNETNDDAANQVLSNSKTDMNNAPLNPDDNVTGKTSETMGDHNNTNTNAIQETKEKSTITNKTVTAKNSLAEKHADSAMKLASKKETVDHIKKKAFFYAGLYTGPDISSVKFQQINTPGYNLGLLLGYHINKKVSIESGALLEKKFYYSTGEYFSKSRLSYLNWVNVLSVTGDCYMIDIPVNIKYNFRTNKKNNWFATTGISSYLMTKEYYDFSYEYNGTVGKRGYTYHNSTNNWFSVINLSAGYEHVIGKSINLRVEPYIKLPIAGLGIGGLSLNSAGLYIGVNKRF